MHIFCPPQLNDFFLDLTQVLPDSSALRRSNFNWTVAKWPWDQDCSVEVRLSSQKWILWKIQAVACAPKARTRRRKTCTFCTFEAISIFLFELHPLISNICKVELTTFPKRSITFSSDQNWWRYNVSKFPTFKLGGGEYAQGCSDIFFPWLYSCFT